MNELLGYFFGYGALGAFYIGAFAVAMAMLLGSLVFPQLLLFGILATTMVFPSSPTSALGGGSGFNAYGKGGGYFVLSLYEMALVAIALAVPLHNLFRRQLARRHSVVSIPFNPYSKYFALLFLLYLAYVAVDLLTPSRQVMLNLGRGGVINIYFQWCLIAALLAHFAEPVQRERTAKALGAVLLLEMAWGLLRYAVLGGDPQSSYEGEGGGVLKLTFWDINYSILAAMAASFATWRAANLPADSHRGLARFGWISLAVILFAIIGLSGRRTAQLGALLTMLVLVAVLPRGRRWLAVVVIVMALPVALYKTNARLHDDRPLIQKLLKGTERQRYFVDPRFERTYELGLAWDAVKKEPYFGLGPTGGFNPVSSIGIDFHKGNYGFIHSGFGHVLMKFGFVGLFIFTAIYFEYGRLIWRRWRVTSMGERTWLTTSLGGMACAVPNLVVGTPIIEVRSMVVLGLILTLPLLVVVESR